MDDESILDLFFERSEQAVGALAAKYGGLVRRVTGNILGNADDAEECENDVYLACWNTIPPSRPERLPGYVCRIARNLAVKRYRSNAAQKRNSHYDAALEELAECLAAPETTESRVEARELSAAVNAFLSTLNREDRQMFVRRYYFADSVSEIAAALHVSGGRVSVRLFRVRERLHHYLMKEGLM